MMSLCRSTRFAYVVRRNYSPPTTAAATVSSLPGQDRSTPPLVQNRGENKPSFAKSLYVGNFVKDLFVRRTAGEPVSPESHDKLYGVSVPEGFGGLQLSAASVSKAYKRVGFAGCKPYLGHGAVVKCIDAYGTDQQKVHYLPRLASGELVATACLYESKHGYDIQSCDTKASYADGKWTINGSKQWVCNGKQADLFLVLARTMDECNRPEDGVNFFTAFLVKKLSSGIRVASDGDHYNVTFDNVQAECMLGPENDGLTLYALLFNADLLESSSATVGELETIVQDAAKNLKIQDRSSTVKLGKLNSHLYTMNCVLDFTSLVLDTYDPKCDYELILARSFVNETVRGCLDLLNDLGVSKKSHRHIEDSLLFEGRSNLLQFVGALLGIQFAGQYMADDIRQLRNPLMFPKYTISHIMRIQGALNDKPKLKHYVENFLHPSLKKQALDLEYCLCRFHLAVQNMFVNLGPDTCYFQMILERANMVAMDLFVMCAVLHRVSHKLSNPSSAQLFPTELVFANVFSNSIREQCSRRISEILDAPHNVIDPHLKVLGTNCFVEKKYFLEHPLKRNIY